jgi:hypothetical protein
MGTLLSGGWSYLAVVVGAATLPSDAAYIWQVLMSFPPAVPVVLTVLFLGAFLWTWLRRPESEEAATPGSTYRQKHSGAGDNVMDFRK